MPGDNVTIDNGSLTDFTPATDERTIAATAVHVQRVSSEGGTSIVTGQVTVTTTAGTLVAARETRLDMTLLNNSGQDVWVGPATVTTVNGFKLVPGSAITLRTTALVQAIIASGTMTGTVDYAETYA